MSKILVVDDDPIQRKLLRLRLELAGFEVEVAFDGVQGLDMVRSWRFDAVVCDVQLPVVSGLDFCAEVRRDPALARLPVILVSAVFTEPEDRERGSDVGASAYLFRVGSGAEQLQALVLALEASFPTGASEEP